MLVRIYKLIEWFSPYVLNFKFKEIYVKHKFLSVGYWLILGNYKNRFNKYRLPLLPMKMERENDFDSNNIEGQFTPCVMPVYKVKCKPEKARIRQVC